MLLIRIFPASAIGEEEKNHSSPTCGCHTKKLYLLIPICQLLLNCDSLWKRPAGDVFQRRIITRSASVLVFFLLFFFRPAYAFESGKIGILSVCLVRCSLFCAGRDRRNEQCDRRAQGLQTRTRLVLLRAVRHFDHRRSDSRVVSQGASRRI